MRRLAGAALLAARLAALLPGGARAALTEAQLAGVALHPPPGAALPPGLALRDEAGHPVRAGAAQQDRPAVLVFADYTCTVLCGTALGLAAAALAETGLRAGADYTVLALGLDPKDGPAAAAAMKALHFPAAPAGAVRFLGGDAAALQAARSAFGYEARYDAETDSYAHPLGVLVLAPDGRLSRVLGGLALDPPALRLALVEAAEGRLGSLGERLRLFCYGFDAARGVWTAWIRRVLMLGSVATSLALGGFMLWALRRERRA
ncbi:thioredoxin domain-containing protein [Teichococcus aestuarii]|uniref:hypothetical protein n=1 Tax=Teichococcus aestuarii TaxID=568898 RepID=UPI0036077E4E